MNIYNFQLLMQADKFTQIKKNAYFLSCLLITSNLNFDIINLFEIKVTFDDKVCVKFWNIRMLKRLTSLAGVKESRFNQAEVILLSEYHAKIQSRTFMNVGLTCNIWIKISKIERNFDFKKSARLEKQNCLPFSLSITYYTLSNFMLFGDPPIYLLTKYPKKKKLAENCFRVLKTPTHE